jgi:hypothetical protein
MLVAVLLFVPYATTLSPAVALQVVDEQGQPIPNLSVTWRGGFYAAYFEEPHLLDDQGRLTVQERRVWMTPAFRFARALKCLVPHNAGPDHSADVYFWFPDGRSFDGNRGAFPLVLDSGATGGARTRVWSLPGGWDARLNGGMTGLSDQLILSKERPAAGAAISCQIVLPATRPTGPS